jgi:hypothetical protein
MIVTLGLEYTQLWNSVYLQTAVFFTGERLLMIGYQGGNFILF